MQVGWYTCGWECVEDFYWLPLFLQWNIELLLSAESEDGEEIFDAEEQEGVKVS